MWYELIEFNAEYISSLTLEDFTEQNKANYFLNQSDEVRIVKLKEVYDACCLKVKGVGEPQPEAASTLVPETKKLKEKSANSNANNGEMK